MKKKKKKKKCKTNCKKNYIKNGFNGILKNTTFKFKFCQVLHNS